MRSAWTTSPRTTRSRQVLHVVEQDRRVGQDHALGARVRDVALVPQGDVLDGGLWRCRAARARGRVMRSLVIGLRLWGIALEPFCCPERNGSSASRTSVRCRWRISVASRSRPAPASAIACSSSAWRSRGTTWVETGSAARPEAREHARLELRAGGRVRPDGAADRPDRRLGERALEALRRCAGPRTRSPASLMPNVVGSAWTPCVRPTQTVSTCSRARSASAATRLARARDDDLARGACSWSASAVSSTSERRQPEVDPAPGRAGARAEHVDEGRDVVVGDLLALLHGLDGERRARGSPRGRRRSARPSPRRRRPRRGARPPCAPRRSRSRRARGGCSDRSRGQVAAPGRPARADGAGRSRSVANAADGSPPSRSATTGRRRRARRCRSRRRDRRGSRR